MPVPAVAAERLAAVRKSPGNRVKVAVSDIDGILRGKYLHKDKFESAVEAASASATSCSAGTRRTSATTTRRSPAGTRAFPTRSRASTSARIATCRGTTTSLLPRRVHRPQRRQGSAASALPAAGAEARAEARREARLHADVRHGVRVVQLRRDAADRGPTRRASARRRSRRACSAIRCCAPTTTREFFKALMTRWRAFGVPIEGLHTETGPGVYEAAILFSEALEAGRPRRPVQDRREGDRRALRHHAELHGEVEPAISGLLAATSTSRCPTARRTCSTTRRAGTA